jgi:hypothetical protein
MGLTRVDFDDCSTLLTSKIHNPTLCLIYFWITTNLFPGSSDSLKDDELKLLYAMVHKIEISPVKLMIRF